MASLDVKHNLSPLLQNVKFQAHNECTSMTLQCKNSLLMGVEMGCYVS